MPITFDENGEVVLTPYDEPEAGQAADYADQLFAQPGFDTTGNPTFTMEDGVATSEGGPNSSTIKTVDGLGNAVDDTVGSLGGVASSLPTDQPRVVPLGGSASVSGFHEPTFNYLQTKGAKGYEAERRNAANEATANTEREYNSRAAINESQKSATADIARIEGEKSRINAEAAVQAADLTRDYHQDVEKAYTQGKLEADAAFNDYANLMQEIRATQINPTQMWDNMSGGQRFGTLASVFIHDFLGAKGIQTSTMSTINKAIDRNIEAQIANLNNKRTVAAGFKDIYNMVRERSESDIEAKTKLHGIMLSAFKDDVAAKLYGMDSELARSKGVLAMSELDKEVLNKMHEIRKWEDQKAQTRVNQYLEKRGQDTQASIARLQVGARMAEIEAAKKPAVDLNELNKLVVKAEGGKVLGTAPDEKSRERLQIAATGVDNLNMNMDRLIELQRQIKGKYSGIGKDMFTSPEYAELESIYTETVRQLVEDMNKGVASEQDVEDYKKVIKFDTLTTGLFTGVDPADSVNAAFNERRINGMRTTLKNELRPVPPEVAAALGGGTNYNPWEGYEAKRQTDRVGPAPLDKVDRIFAESEHDVNLNDVVIKQTPELIESWKNWTGKDAPTAGSGGMPNNLKTIPQWFGQLHRLRELATDPAEDLGQRQKAIGKLFEVSQSGDNLWNKTTGTAEAASSLLYEINDDLFHPQNLKEKRAAEILQSKVKKTTPTGVEESDYYSEYVNMINSAPGVEN